MKARFPSLHCWSIDPAAMLQSACGSSKPHALFSVHSGCTTLLQNAAAPPVVEPLELPELPVELELVEPLPVLDVELLVLLVVDRAAARSTCCSCSTRSAARRCESSSWSSAVVVPLELDDDASPTWNDLV